MSGSRNTAGGRRRRGSKGSALALGKIVAKVAPHRIYVYDYDAGVALKTDMPREPTSSAIDWAAERRKTQEILADLDVSAKVATRREAQEGVRFGTL